MPSGVYRRTQDMRPGRKKIAINHDAVREMIGKGLSVRRIAEIIGCDPSTLRAAGYRAKSPNA